MRWAQAASAAKPGRRTLCGADREGVAGRWGGQSGDNLDQPPLEKPLRLGRQGGRPLRRRAPLGLRPSRVVLRSGGDRGLLPTTLGPKWPEWPFILAELLLVLSIVGIMIMERKRHWHERWLEYRVLAEHVRELRLLTLLGGQRITARTPRAHLTAYGDAQKSWMAWHARALSRELGLPDLAVTPDYARACAADLAGLARGQKAFHETTDTRAELITSG